MKIKFESLVKLIFLSITFIFFSKVCFSDYKEPSEDEATIGDQKFWYHPVQESLYYCIYVPVGYYISPRGVFRLLSVLAMGYRNYYEFYLHRKVFGKVDLGLLIFAVALIPLNLIYDILEDRMASSDSDITEIKTANTMGLHSIELELSGLAESNPLYDISKPLRNLGVSNIIFTSSQIDNEMHLLGGLTQIGESDKMLFDIKFPTLDFDNYYWIELSCNENSDCNTSSSIPLSVLSEEVINELVLFLNVNYSLLESISDFKRVKGVDFSVNERLVVVKIQRREPDTVSYSVCDTQAHSLQLKNNHLKFSNQTLVFEIKNRLFAKPEGWFTYILKLVVKQFEHIAFIWINDSFFERIFLGECGICHQAMVSGAILLANCDRHCFCTSCLNQWAQHGSGRCPYCR